MPLLPVPPPIPPPLLVRPRYIKITPDLPQRGLGQTVRRRSITMLAPYNEPTPFCSRRMKPSSWYSTTVLVVFFYLYVLAVQYIRAAEVLPDQDKVSFQDEAPRRLSPSEQRVLSRPDSPLALTSYGGGEESLDIGGESQDGGGESLRSVGVGSASLDRAVDYRPGYNLDPAYNQYYDSSQGTDPSYGLEFKYHDFEQLTKFLRTTSSQYPSLTALYSIGKSVQGRRHFMFTAGKTGLAIDSGVRGNVFRHCVVVPIRLVR
uniref:Uncharacterized protein n=1 Tax=Timema genevievae TaxID=629358 RepID=A0A7R9K0P9_TIMGE|nr:unnamed protein product [Timema genevievae]